MGCEHASQVLVGEGHADRVIAVVNCPDHFHEFGASLRRYQPRVLGYQLLSD